MTSMDSLDGYTQSREWTQNVPGYSQGDGPPSEGDPLAAARRAFGISLIAYMLVLVAMVALLLQEVSSQTVLVLAWLLMLITAASTGMTLARLMRLRRRRRKSDVDFVSGSASGGTTQA